MSSLEETVEKQAETINQLAELMERNESRHRSLERTIRWMGLSVFILAIMLIVPVNQESLLRIVHATGSDSAPSALKTAEAPAPTPAVQKEQPMQCAQIANANCDQVQEMATKLAMNVFGQIIGQLNVDNLKGTLVGYSPEYLSFAKNRINKEILSLEEQEKKTLNPIEKAYIKSRIDELKENIKFAAKMTILDHIANIDYDFDRLGGMKTLLSSMMNDMNNMSSKMTNMSSRMDTMARDMHNMNTMAFDIHNMAVAGVPVMGRMNTATSWMPW